MALIPPLGYEPERMCSAVALKWLMYLEATDGLGPIQHAKNKGEYVALGAPVDGYRPCVEGVQTVYQFHVSWDAVNF